jgi:hypothetical protein
MSLLTFNFHQLVGVQVESNDSGALHFFESEYRSSASVLSEDINQVTLHWKRSIWPFAKGYQIQIHKGLARWAYRISVQTHQIQIDAIGNQIAVPMVHHMLVHPSMRYLCVQDGALMLHGSSVVWEDKSLVFTGTGGVGKTTVSSLILKHGGNDWRLHADDYVFLAKGPTSFAYMTRSHLYRDQIRWVPTLEKSLSPRERLHLEFFGRLREITKDRIKWPLRVEASQLWPDHRIAPQANLAAIVILKRGNVDRLNLKQIDTMEGLVQELVQMNFYEARHFVNLIRKAYGEVYTEAWIIDWRQREKELLEQILKDTRIFQLDLPPSETAGVSFGRELVETLKPIMSVDQNEGLNA